MQARTGPIGGLPHRAVTKPRPEVFSHAFAGPGEPDRSTALMIGDSSTSDIAGGRNYGIDTCWHRRGTTPPHVGSTIATHEVTSLGEIPDIAIGDAR